MSKQKNWQSFGKILKGSKYSSPQKSTLYRKYKQGIIDEHELKSPKTLTKYLNDDYDYKAMKTRLLSYFKNFKSFSKDTLEYIKDSYLSLKGDLEYVENIKQDPDDEIDYIIEETQKIVNQLENNKFKSVSGTGFTEILDSLIIFNEKEIATDLLQKMAEIDDSVNYDLYIDLYKAYKHFPKSFGGKLGDLKVRLIDKINKFRSIDKKFRMMGERIEIDIKKYKKNPEKSVENLILDYLKFKNRDYIGEYDMEWGYPLEIFIALGEPEIAYNLATEGDHVTNDMYTIYSYFGDWVEKNKGISFLRHLKNIVKITKLNDDETAKIINFYDSSNEKLIKKMLELEKKVLELEEKVIDLTYRPGGPGFELAKSRQVGKYGLKR